MASILLVDPNAAFRRMMEQLLRQQGHEVWGADDAETAGRAMRDSEFDIAIVELVLAGDMTGTEFLEWLRDFPAPGNPVRIALCSLPSFASQESYLRAELQLDGFLLKPFKPSSFKQLIDDAVAARVTRPKTKEPLLPPPPEIGELGAGDLIPLETNPDLANAPAPSAADFETASAEGAISLEALAPPPVSDRRAVPRYAVRLPVAVHDGKTPFKSRSENLGRGGTYVASDRHFAAGTRLRVRLELPVPGPGFNEVLGEVIHADAPGGGSRGFGLRFLEMSDETARRLDTFLEELRKPAVARPFLVVASATLSGEVEQIAQQFRNEEVRVRLLNADEDPQPIAEADPPDLVLLDLDQPKVSDGVGALKSSRATSRIPVGLIDRTHQPQVALIAAAAGADRFFVLPDDLSRLVNFSVDTLAASKRRSVRVRFQRPIIVAMNHEEHQGAAVDLSETGVQVRLGVVPVEGSIVKIGIPLSDGLNPLELDAKVTWVHAANDGSALSQKVGLVFDPDESSRARLREEVRKALHISYYVRWLSSTPKAARTPSAGSPVAPPR